jgi:glutamate carboxypeptidase
MKKFIQHLNWIDSKSNYMQELVKKWSEINSFSTHLTGLSELLNQIGSDFGQLNGIQRRLQLGPQKTIATTGKIIEQPLGAALQIRKRPLAPIQVFLGGHIDTVYPPSSPFQKVVEKDADCWIGPGVTDMKGGLAILLIALAAFEQSPFADQLGWEILINPDEEIGSPGSAPFFEEAAKRNHFGLIFEPSFPDGAFVSSRKGSSTYTILFKGRSAHVGRDYASGSHAIYALAEFIQKIEKLNESEKGFIANVGYVEGGGPVNIVPESSALRLNIRSSEEKDIVSFGHQLEKISSQCQKREGIQINIFNESLRMPKPFDEKTQALFKLYGGCAAQLGLPYHLRETGGVCDGNILAGAGLPTLDSIGAMGGKIHTHEEYLFLPSLVYRAQLAALFLFKIATREIIFPKV